LQGVVLFFEDSMKITAAVVWHKACNVLCLRHIHLRRDSCCFVRTSCLSRCLVRTLNAAGGKVHPSFHQIEELVFSLAANDGHVSQVDDQCAPS